MVETIFEDDPYVEHEVEWSGEIEKVAEHPTEIPIFEEKGVCQECGKPFIRKLQASNVKDEENKKTMKVYL